MGKLAECQEKSRITTPAIPEDSKTIGKSNQSYWEKSYSWLSFDQAKNLVFCDQCTKAVEMKMLLPTC